jgi:hypothetical protein
MPALKLYLFFPTLGFTFGSVLAAQRVSLADGVVARAVISAIKSVFWRPHGFQQRLGV